MDQEHHHKLDDELKKQNMSSKYNYQGGLIETITVNCRSQTIMNLRNAKYISVWVHDRLEENKIREITGTGDI